MKKKKVVVYTFSDTLDNYGQVLQYLATQIFLDKQGCETSILRYKVEKTIRDRIKRKIKQIIFRLKAINKRTVQNIQTDTTVLSDMELRNLFFQKAKGTTLAEDKKHPRYFEQFRTKHFRQTMYKNLLSNPPQADVYCVGSDQSWSWCADENFLNYGADNIKRISFAPSFGAYFPQEPEEWDALSKKLQRFNLVTVREKSGVEICRRAGRPDARLIPDSTLLLHADEYRIYEAEEIPTTKDYIFLYLLGNPTDIDISQIYGFASKEGLEVIYVTSQGREDSYPHMAATIPQWLSCIKQAKYVMTNSFHGMVFSIIYNKQFLVFPLVYPFHRMNGRIDTLLDKYQLENHKYIGDLEAVKIKISYERINAMRENEIKEVSTLIAEILK